MWRSQVSPRRQPKSRRPRVVAFEGVEPRQMMSITQMPIVITGTNNDDNIELHFEQTGGHDWFVWTINGQGHALKDWDPTYIELDGLGGHDNHEVGSNR